MPSNSVLDTVLHSTLEKSRRNLIMASVKANAFVAWAMQGKRVDYESGGEKITNPLLTGRNPNVGTFSYYDQLDVAQTNEFNTVEYYWSRFAGTVIISGQEEDENRGPEAIFKLMKGKMKALEESVQEKFSEYLYGSGSGNDPYGLSALVPDDPTTGTLGGISRATETQWRTSSYDFSAAALTSSTIEEALDDVLLDLTVKKDKPDLILMGRNLFRLYREAIRDKVAIDFAATGNGKRMVDLGFTAVSHQNIPIMYDEDCGVNKMYFINSKYMRLHVLKHVNMRSKKLVSPWTMDGTGSRTLWQGQMAMWKAHRTHAVLNNA